jgi:hypothetical protein
MLIQIYKFTYTKTLTLPADAVLLSEFVSAELQAGADSMASSVSAVPEERPCYLPAH